MLLANIAGMCTRPTHRGVRFLVDLHSRSSSCMCLLTLHRYRHLLLGQPLRFRQVRKTRSDYPPDQPHRSERRRYLESLSAILNSQPYSRSTLSMINPIHDQRYIDIRHQPRSSSTLPTNPPLAEDTPANPRTSFAARYISLLSILLVQIALIGSECQDPTVANQL